MTKCYAHTKTNPEGRILPPENWETLFTNNSDVDSSGNSTAGRMLHPQYGHLNKVAWLCGEFAAELVVKDEKTASVLREWGELIGWWHDIGKFAPKWQAYLESKADPHQAEVMEKIDHATAGAQHAVSTHGILGHLLAFGIAGHHSGLLDSGAGNPLAGTQKGRLDKQVDFQPDDAPEELLKLPIPPLPDFLKCASGPQHTFSLCLFVRMLYSCLVDADFLATESFMSAEKHRTRNQPPPKPLEAIKALLDQHIARFGVPSPDDTVNRMRAEVVQNCREAAAKSPGLFTLTVPTGGGKTLSSLAFALEHAIRHGQQRIICVVPFTSIIEQNAEVIRSIVQPLETDTFTPLIEHHSAYAPDAKEESTTSRLAAENWDAPIIITTAVQFYESLFAAKTSRSRKVHNIANAVVILDEAQTLPVDFLSPCLRVLEELSQNYNTTCVLCTATQPAIKFDETYFPIGLKNLREIIQNPPALFHALKRVELQNIGKFADPKLVEEMADEEQVLCIVNRRKHAQKLYQMLGTRDGNYHLSALMCPEHRSNVLLKVRERLRDGLPARLVSTQLIEAGVDVDFPLVYRALAGLDSIAQAAGRCNRNGKLGRLGSTYIFTPESDEESERRAETYFRETAQITSRVMECHDDLLGEDAIRHYFDLYYYSQKERWDSQCILARENMRLGDKHFPFIFNFKTIAEKFQLIDDWQQPVIIPFDEKAKALIDELRNEHIPLNRHLLRGLQRYTVQISPKLLQQNWNSFEHLRDGQFHVLISKDTHYNENFGLNLSDEYASSQSLIV